VSLPADVDLASYAEGPREECGVFGIFAPGEDVATLTFYGLYALQHRGQESAGIAVSDGDRIVVHKDMGLVNQVFRPTGLAAMRGHIAIGHTRYSTTGSSSWVQRPAAVPRDAVRRRDRARPQRQPRQHRRPRSRARHDHAQRLGRHGRVARPRRRRVSRGGDRPDRPAAAGAFSVVAMDEERIYAFRDPHGVRPLVIGRLPTGGWVVASETAALDIVGAIYVRDVEPGELVMLDERGMHARRFADPTPHFCLFEWVYLARPDHRQDGRSVLFARREMGRVLAREAPADADIVIPVPDSGRDAAAGYAAEIGLPFADGLVKNRYVGRTFIQPSQTLRQLGIRLKLSPVRELIEGRRLVVVDDSIVRGNTSRQLIAMLRAAGAAEVHLRICSPPIAHPCYYGIDMATRAELIGADLSVEEIRDFIGADSLHYISLEGLQSATPNEPDALCTACFTGRYPIPVPGEHQQLAQFKFDFDDRARLASRGTGTRCGARSNAGRDFAGPCRCPVTAMGISTHLLRPSPAPGTTTAPNQGRLGNF
jgi:amidophosphoribosyltransferase